MRALAFGLVVAVSAHAGAQVRVSPTGVSVNANGPTTVFLTFGGVGTRVAREGMWCGALIPATPDMGARCDPATIFGVLPARYDLRTPSGRGALTDVMSIPPAVAMRAYQDAVRGARSTFFYVRRFESPTGGPDEYVAVTCRLTGGGARTPFALTDVRLAFAEDVPVLALAAGARVPPVAAIIAYNGTGRLRGRWEVVLPGEELPDEADLLTEATLPLERRGTQRRYTELARFNVFLPPGGRVTLPGPPTDRVPTRVEGTHLLLLRVEADDEREGDSDLAAVGAGEGVAHSGAVAGFPLRPLRYVVGAGQSPGDADDPRPGDARLIGPEDGAVVPADTALVLRWHEDAGAARHRLELVGTDGATLFTAYVARGVVRYVVPPFVRAPSAGRALDWRIVALDDAGRTRRRTAWRRVTLAPAGG
ncbi:MAG TPA: hypothetical protein VFS59_14775 [Gemmatimonadaceae bacterium]|nr:hypothetical protein [Gemmatimonadaceae bacterium]